MNNAPVKDNTREYGPREKITCNLPNASAQHRRMNYVTDQILQDLETALCQQFGGYTSTPSVGGWMDGDGNVMHESGTLYTVSYPATGILPTGGPDNEKSNGTARRLAAIALFVEAGERLGEEWIHIERSDFQAEHRKTAASDSDYDNAPQDRETKFTCKYCGREYFDSWPVCTSDDCPDNAAGRAERFAELNRAETWDADKRDPILTPNISKIRQLDKSTRDHINNPGRSTEFARR